jgi:hypothetical protein
MSRLAFITEDRVCIGKRNPRVCVEATPEAVVMRLERQPDSQAIQVSWATMYAYARNLNALAQRERVRAERVDLVRREGARKAVAHGSR